MPTSFVKSINNIATTVAAPYTAGGPYPASLTVTSAAGITLTADQWIRLSTERSGTPLGILKATAVTGNVLTIAGPIEGYADVDLHVGDAVELRITAGAFADIHAAVNALETSIAGSIITGNIPGDAASITRSITESQVSSLTTDPAAKAPLASPALTEAPTAPTAATADDSTAIATTAHVKGQGYTYTYTYTDDFVCVDDPAYGAKGDGATNDTLAIRAAIATGKNIRFGSGKTYMISGSLALNTAGQVVFLNGATIKQLPQVQTTIKKTYTGTASGSSTPTTINVTSTVGFNVGDTVSLSGPGPLQGLYVTNGGSNYTGTPTITISGGGGTGATANTTMGIDSTTKQINSLNMVNAGTGYLTQPTITISGGGGSGATAQAYLTTTDPTSGSNACEITEIDTLNNIITINGQFSQTFDITALPGTTLYTTAYVFNLLANDCAVVGPGTIDGNRSNFTIGRWQTAAAIRMAASRGHVRQVHIQNTPGEGIVCFSDYNTIFACVLENLSGNGVHFTLSPQTVSLNGMLPGGHAVVDGVRVYNCNLDYSVGHADGGIIWSNNISHATIVNCLVDTTPRFCIGSIDCPDNSDVTISNCTLKNGYMGAINMNPNSANDGAGRIVVTGNRIYQCGTRSYNPASSAIYNNGTIMIVVGGTSRVKPNRIVVSNNYIDTSISLGSAIVIRGGIYITCTGNVLEQTNTNVGAAGVLIQGGQQLTVTNNVINGFSYGVLVQADSTILAANVNITGNTLVDNHTAGILVATALGENIAVVGNTVENDANADPAWIGIQAGDNCSVIGNSIYSFGGSGSIGISVIGSRNNVQSNQVRGAASQPVTAILVAASTTNNVITNNAITSNAGTALNLNGTTINNTTAGNGNYTTA